MNQKLTDQQIQNDEVYQTMFQHYDELLKEMNYEDATPTDKLNLITSYQLMMNAE